MTEWIRTPVVDFCGEHLYPADEGIKDLRLDIFHLSLRLAKGIVKV